MPRDTRASILIVDDNPNKLTALEVALAPLGQRTVSADSGRAALRRLLHEDFAVILLDVRMAEMDGFETAELIRRRRRSERTPIIFVTAFGEAESDMARGYSLGAVDFVFSPINPDVLRNKVAVFVDLFLKSEEVRRQGDRLRRLEALEHRRRLERAETGRRQAEARFATMLDIAGDAILAVDGQGTIVLFNQAAERAFGRTAGDTIGRGLEELVGAEHAERLVADGLAVAGAERLELSGRRADGSSFPAEVSVARTPDGDRDLWTVILRDISERREAEEHVRRLNAALDERLRVGVEMVADLVATLDVAEVVGRLLRRAGAIVRADWGTLVRIDPRLQIVESAHDVGSGHAVDDLPLDGQPLLVRALREHAPVMAAPFDPDSLPALRRAWGSDVGSVAALPLTVADQVVAVLVLGRRDAAGFSGDDVDMLTLIGNVATLALRNAELFEQAQESSRSKSDFLNLAAHELRTPLSVIRGYASMLADGTLGHPPELFVTPLHILMVKLTELNGLVDDLLTAARVEAGRVRSQPETIDLRMALAEAAARCAPRADLLEAEVVLETSAEPLPAEVDPDHITRILDNLVNNALTYSSGGPWVRLSGRRREGRVEVLVEDRGPGIPADMRDRIFERFVRFDHPSLGPRPGTGLGLYISRELAEQHGGALRLEASGDGGSCFVLELPLAAVGENVPQTAHGNGALAVEGVTT